MTVSLYQPDKLLWIAGPCSLEGESVCRAAAAALAALRERFPELTVVFKGSFDKANRTSLAGDRGPGLEEGLRLLAAVKEDFGLPVLTDVHESAQIPEVAEVCDVLQIPAFLCRQSDLLAAAARSGRAVNVKKGQFLAPADMRYVVEKLEGAGADEIWLTERGATFGYHNLVVDMRSFPLMRAIRRPAIIDATHSVQLPGAAGGRSGGQREFIPDLAAAALAAGADGVFVETHPSPDEAISDGPNQVPLDRLEELAQRCLDFWTLRRRWE